MTEHDERIAETRTRLAERDLDAALFGAGPNLQYLTGSTVDWRRCPDLDAAKTTLLVPTRGDPLLIAGPFAAVDDDLPCEARDIGPFDDPGPIIAGALDETVPTGSRLGVDPYADGSVVVKGATRTGVELVSAEGLLSDARAGKSDAEVDRLREVAALTDDVMAEVVDGLEPGDTMREVELRIETLARERGASHVSFPSTAIFNDTDGRDADGMANYDDDEPLAAGTCVAFDVGFVLDGYCSDWGRSVYVGDPPARVVEAYAALQTAVTEAIDAIGDDIRHVDEVYPFVESVCDREGVGDLFRNRHADAPAMGHGIGVEVHEDPWLRPDADAEFEEGMVFAIEPKLWEPGEFYLRVEDMVHVTRSGAESLTTFDRDRFEV